MARMGSLLETTMKNIFNLAGFKAKTNVKIKTYEIDVLAEYKGYTIAIEAKERGTGGLIIRNLIHEWSGKNKIVKADRILLAIYGINIKASDRKLAAQNGIIIWNDRKIKKMFDLAIEKKNNIRDEILSELNLEGIETRKPIISEQQMIIEEALEKLIEKGKDNPFVTFTESKNGNSVQVLSDDDVLGFNFGKLDKDKIEKIRKLLISRKFKEMHEINWNFKGLQFSENNKTIDAICGNEKDGYKKLDFVSALVDDIFKAAFGCADDYKIEVELALEG